MKLCSIFLLILLDSSVIRDLRSFLWDFLMIRRNRGGMKKNLMKQSRKDRITLSYIEPLLKKNQKPYRIWHSLYLWVIYSLIPQYVLLLVALIAKNMRRNIHRGMLIIKSSAKEKGSHAVIFARVNLTKVPIL